ncbi:MAG: hypothetical protein ABIY47_02370 [Opitutaceae bacterium]
MNHPHAGRVPAVDTKSASAVEALIVSKFSAMFPGAGLSWIRGIIRDVNALFCGQHPDYAKIDVGYHDLEHTLQATVCLVLLLEGRHAAAVEPRFGPRQFELAIAAVLLHDTGYLKLRSDKRGTGAKYTFCHVLRSCAFAAAYLPKYRASRDEIEEVLGTINCTGPSTAIDRIYFKDASARTIGCAVATADYLAQMAAPDYPDELEILYREFRESDDFLRTPPAERSYKNAQQLIQHTPVYWEAFVRPRLEMDFQAVYRFLARPSLDGPNPYIEAIERNMATIKGRVAVRRLRMAR